MLAHGAVHGAFAGFTGITVGLVNTHVRSHARRPRLPALGSLLRRALQLSLRARAGLRCRARTCAGKADVAWLCALWQLRELCMVWYPPLLAQQGALCCPRLCTGRRCVCAGRLRLGPVPQTKPPSPSPLPPLQYCYLPIPLIIQAPRRVDPHVSACRAARGMLLRPAAYQRGGGRRLAGELLWHRRVGLHGIHAAPARASRPCVQGELWNRLRSSIGQPNFE